VAGTEKTPPKRGLGRPNDSAGTHSTELKGSAGSGLHPPALLDVGSWAQAFHGAISCCHAYHSPYSPALSDWARGGILQPLCLYSRGSSSLQGSKLWFRMFPGPGFEHAKRGL